MAGLKALNDIRRALGRKLTQCYAEDVAGVAQYWPYVLPLGHPSRKELLEGLNALDALIRTLRAWDRELGTATAYAIREAGGPKRVPTHVSIPSADVAATLAPPRKDGPWTYVLEQSRSRCRTLRNLFAELDDKSIARALRALDGCEDLEFELVCEAGRWFGSHDAHGLTSRQVPIPGIDSKWLKNKKRQELLCLLANKDTLGLVDWPATLSFSYLDHTHLAQGGRRYDSWVCDDIICPAYAPHTVVIVENKDTYLGFPELEHAICIFGSGFSGPSLVRRLPWVLNARRVVYWGDLDADGFQILNSYRANGITCRSILMDETTLQRFGRYGTNLEKDHRTRITRERKELEFLTHDELAAYLLITDPSYTGNRRLEQERIPLSEALHAIASL